MLYDFLPAYLNLKVFGSLCFASTFENQRTKLDPRAKMCIFLGYENGIKDYVLLDLKSREIFISRNIVLYKSIFPYKNSTCHSDDNSIISAINQILLSF